jgi:hypothetical protein
MQIIFAAGRKPKTIRTDGGREFNNANFKHFCTKNDIHPFTTHNTPQASFAERALKTSKSRLYRYMVRKNSLRYINILQSIVKSYNNTKHSSLGRTPTSVTENNEDEVRYDQEVLRDKRHGQNERDFPIQSWRFKINDKVRISFRREPFDREYGQRWSGEFFTVTTRFRRNGIPLYRLKDWHDEPILGTFYQQQLQLVDVDPEGNFKVEKILKRRRRRGIPEVLVKFLHWPKKYNQWIREADVVNIRNDNE